MVPIMDRSNELQNVEASKTSSSEIGSGSYLSKKTKIFYSNIIDNHVFNSMVNGI